MKMQGNDAYTYTCAHTNTDKHDRDHSLSQQPIYASIEGEDVNITSSDHETVSISSVHDYI